MKKLLVLLVSVIAAMLIFTSAGPKEEGMTDEVTLNLWLTSAHDAENRELNEMFMEKYPHITLNTIIKEGDPQHEFMQGVAVGNAPDLIEGEFANIGKFIANGVVEPLDDYVDTWIEWPNFTQEYVETLSRNGSVYGIPTEVSPMLFAYNKALFAEHGITEFPKDWDEALAVAKQISDPSNQIIGYATLASEWTEWFFQYYVWQAGGDLTIENPDGTITLTFTDPAVIEAAEYYQTLRAEGLMQSDITLKFGDLLTQFALGNIAMMPFAGDWISGAVTGGMDPDDIGLAIPPEGPGGLQDSAIGGSAYAIKAGLPQNVRDAAFAYISFFASEEAFTYSYEDKASKGASNPVIIARDDMNVGDFYDLPAEYIEILEDAKAIGRGEFYGKPDFGIYVDRVVQKVLTDPDLDIEAEFAAAQALATEEKLADFNKINMR